MSIGSLVTGQDSSTFQTNITSIYDDQSPLLQSQKSVPLSSIEMPSFGSQYAQVSCQRIGLDAPLYWGDNSTILRNGAGQYIGSSLPGFERPILLCGHNVTAFLPLQSIEIGDQVSISTNYGTYTYEVVETRVADMNDTSAYDLSQNKEQLIMYTCYPFAFMGVTTQRLFIYGDRISGPDITGLD
ncbi:MAG: class D sortase [Lachnospira sp.]|nr:class D sortase [Lachnospira sp.]